jgi:hypothetical protein
MYNILQKQLPKQIIPFTVSSPQTKLANPHRAGHPLTKGTLAEGVLATV